VYAEREYWSFEDTHYPNTEALADYLRESNGSTYGPAVTCASLTGFDKHSITDLVTDNGVWMIMTEVNDMQELAFYGPGNNAKKLIDHANCPVLFIPENTDVKMLESVAYVTDLRYCDLNVVNFLKKFNAYIFITHVSASGIPDMDDNYAQELLSDEVAAKTGYNKLFLRNIKGTQRKTDLELIARAADIKMVAIVNKKHQMLDRYLQTDINKKRNYHQLPLLVVPYMNGRF
jgi:hypothetical protein